jgi:hypothetical protein
MIYFARAAFCPLATHESRKWLLIKDIFQFKRWRFRFLASESKQLIPYPTFGGDWSLVGDFRKSCFRIRARAEVNRPMRVEPSVSLGAAVLAFPSKVKNVPLHVFDNCISYPNFACKSRNMAKI